MIYLFSHKFPILYSLEMMNFLQCLSLYHLGPVYLFIDQGVLEEVCFSEEYRAVILHF